MFAESLLLQLGSLLLLAAAVGLICHKLQQPLFFAYIFTGLVVGIFGSQYIHGHESLHFFSELGIAFLLFLVGLELNLKNITHLGRTAVITALAQIVIVATISFSVVTWLGMGIMPSIYIALAMSIASAVISVKYLNDKNATETLYGKLDMVLHLVQDIVAVIAIIILSSLSANSSGGSVGLIEVALMLSKGALLVTAHVFFSQHILPKVFRHIANSPELLLLASIAWCIFGAAVAQVFGFSVEIGAFLAGLGLSSSSYQFQIAGRIKPLRDFFVVLFFITLGLQITISSPLQIIAPALLLSAIVIVLNPLVTAILLGRFGYKRHTAFFASLLMSQIGEFSLVLGALGVTNNHLSTQQGSLITATVLITMLVSSVIVKHEHTIYHKLRPLLLLLERPDYRERRVRQQRWQDHIVIMGAHRLGSDVVDTLQHGQHKVVVVDFDPDRIAILSEYGYPTIYGDATDETVLHQAGVTRAKLIISTIPQHEATLQLMRQLKEHKAPSQIIVTASTINEALTYYRLGASYVIIPKLIGSNAMAQIVKDHLTDLSQLEPAKLLHLQHLSAQGYLGR